MSKLSRRHAILALLLIAAVAFLALSLRGGRPAPRRRGARSGGTAAPSTTAKVERTLRPAAPENADFRRYAALASSSVFGTVSPPPPPPGHRRPVPPPPPFPAPTPPPPPRGPDLSGWSYTGCVTLTGEKLGVVKLGILQNDATSSVDFLAVGDTFLGARVEGLDQDSIRLSSGGSSTTLSRSRDFQVQPLGKGASPTAAPQTPPPNPRQPRGR